MADGVCCELVFRIQIKLARMRLRLLIAIFTDEYFTTSVHQMSAEVYSLNGNNASDQSTTVGGSKPLHRFIKGQPKIIGVRPPPLHTHKKTLIVMYHRF